MKPFKRGKPLANWLLRITLAGFIILIYFHTFQNFNFKAPEFYFSLVYLLLGTMIIIGGLLNTQGLTVVSGLLIFVLSVYFLIVSFKGSFTVYWMDRFLLAALGFYFMTAGNKD